MLQAITALATAPAIDSDLVGRWIKDAQVKPSSVKAYEKGIKRLAKYFASNGISAPTREAMIQYREYLGVKYKSPSTRNLYLTSAKLFFGFLHREGYLPANPAEHLKGFKTGEGHKKSALPTGDVKTIAAHFDTATLKGKRDKALFALMSVCGLRCIEVHRANISDFEPVGSVIRLRVQGKGRDDKTEAVNVPAGVYQLIREYLDARGEVAADNDGVPLFTSLSRNSLGARITVGSISRIIKTALRKSGYDSPRLTAHSLRHTAATTALKSGATLREVQQNLRHKNVAVTQVYLHELDELENSATARTAAALGF